MSRGRTQAQPSLNYLESRCTPAGSVIVSTGPAGISIKGDGLANEIGIRPGAAANTIHIDGLNNTAITGVTGDIDAAGQKVNILMGAGDDRVSFTDTLNLEQLTVNLGTGNDGLNSTGQLSILRDVLVSHRAMPGPKTTVTVNLASQAGERFTVGDVDHPSKFTYQSLGSADDTLNVGVTELLSGQTSQVFGAFSASLGSGNNSVNVKALSLDSLAIRDSSTTLETFNVDVTAPNINDNLGVAIGAGSGVVTTSISTIGGAVSVRNGAAKQPVTVGLFGNTVVQESLTVNLAGTSASLQVRFAGVFGNLRVTNRASQNANSDVSVGTILGTSYLNATQPNSSGTAAMISSTLSSSFMQQGLRVIANGPGTVNTSLPLGTVNVGLQATSRGNDGDLNITSSRINGAVRINATGLSSSQATLGAVTGAGLVTIAGTTFGTFDTTELKSLRLTISGASVAMVNTGTVSEGFTVNSTNVSSTIFNSTGAITGATKITVTGGNLLRLNAVDAHGDVSLTTTRTTTTSVTVTGTVDGSFTVNQKPGGASNFALTGGSIKGNLNLNQAAATSSASVVDTTVEKDFVYKATGMTSSVSLAGGSIGGKASFSGGNSANGSLSVMADDITIGSLSYVGGAGVDSLALDTDPNRIGQSSILGDLIVTLGAGDDTVQFGGQVNGLPSPFQLVNFNADSKLSLNGGLGADKFYDLNSSYTAANLTLLSIDRLTSPP